MNNLPCNILKEKLKPQGIWGNRYSPQVLGMQFTVLTFSTYCGYGVTRTIDFAAVIFVEFLSVPATLLCLPECFSVHGFRYGYR